MCLSSALNHLVFATTGYTTSSAITVQLLPALAMDLYPHKASAKSRPSLIHTAAHPSSLSSSLSLIQLLSPSLPFPFPFPFSSTATSLSCQRRSRVEFITSICMYVCVSSLSLPPAPPHFYPPPSHMLRSHFRHVWEIWYKWVFTLYVRVLCECICIYTSACDVLSTGCIYNTLLLLLSLFLLSLTCNPVSFSINL